MIALCRGADGAYANPHQPPARRSSPRVGVEIRRQAHEANLDAMQSSEIVVLTVKPQTLWSVLEELRGRMQPDQMVLHQAGAPVEALATGLLHSGRPGDAEHPGADRRRYDRGTSTEQVGESRGSRCGRCSARLAALVRRREGRGPGDRASGTGPTYTCS
ncbi:MAG: hypothetical protein WKH64_10285 [Chloroflexia bacterium]